jgi:hypothetical protein
MSGNTPKGYKKYLEFKVTAKLITQDIAKNILYFVLRFILPLIVGLIVLALMPNSGIVAIFSVIVAYKVIGGWLRGENVWKTKM